MRINDAVPDENDPSVNTDDSDSQQTTDAAADSSSFSKLLAKKREAAQETKQFQMDAKTGQGSQNPGGSVFTLSQQANLDRPLQSTAVEGPHSVTLPPELQQVVKEISVAVNTAGNQQVHIELNSNVLKGLHIQIERQDAGIVIQFHSTSDQVSSLIERNMPSLTQGLSDRGVSVSNINVSGPRDAERGLDARNRPTFGSQRGRQGGGR
jgi:hypothetical protein